MTPEQLALHGKKEERIAYPTSDGRPMGETDLHRDDMVDAIETLKLFYEGQKVYVSGNILLYYKPGNRRKHVSPDVLVAKGLEQRQRDYYLLWEEGKPPDVVIEVTSESTREEDLEDKLEIYCDQVKVKEYFLFDPRSEYLDPPLQGYRLERGAYVPIASEGGRLPSRELGLHLEKSGTTLRFYNPLTGKWLPTREEARQAAEAARREAEAARQRAEAEAERLRRELEALRREKGGKGEKGEKGR
ncbi:MAG: Uma2 family endonuclease [Planctomycetes bacterium]|nr:Uma2 family endonuclease [Planctomycetota bacterium]